MKTPLLLTSVVSFSSPASPKLPPSSSDPPFGKASKTRLRIRPLGGTHFPFMDINIVVPGNRYIAMFHYWATLFSSPSLFLAFQCDLFLLPHGKYMIIDHKPNQTSVTSMFSSSVPSFSFLPQPRNLSHSWIRWTWTMSLRHSGHRAQVNCNGPTCQVHLV